MSDLISRADAIEAVCSSVMNAFDVPPTKGYDVVEDALSALPSTEAEPTVIRSKTLLPTKDFMEWAKRIKEVNPNAVVIPCDAEVASAEAVQGVLCKSCRYYDESCAVCRCPQWDLSRTEYPKVKENDFCSYGEASDED